MLSQIKQNTLVEKELNEPSEKVKAICKKGLANDLISKSSILNGAKYFSWRMFQNYLGVIPAKKSIKYFGGTTQIYSRKSNGMSERNIENITKWNSNFAPTLVNHHVLPGIIFDGHLLIDKNISIPKNVRNLYIFLEY